MKTMMSVPIVLCAIRKNQALNRIAFPTMTRIGRGSSVDHHGACFEITLFDDSIFDQTLSLPSMLRTRLQDSLPTLYLSTPRRDRRQTRQTRLSLLIDRRFPSIFSNRLLIAKPVWRPANLVYFPTRFFEDPNENSCSPTQTGYAQHNHLKDKPRSSFMDLGNTNPPRLLWLFETHPCQLISIMYELSRGKLIYLIRHKLCYNLNGLISRWRQVLSNLNSLHLRKKRVDDRQTPHFVFVDSVLAVIREQRSDESLDANNSLTRSEEIDREDRKKSHSL